MLASRRRVRLLKARGLVSQVLARRLLALVRQLQVRLGVEQAQQRVLLPPEPPELQPLRPPARLRVQRVAGPPQPAPQLAEQSLRDPTARGQRLERVEPERQLRRQPAHEHRWQREFPRSVEFQPVVQ